MNSDTGNYSSEQINYDFSSVENAMRCLKGMQVLEENPNFGMLDEHSLSGRYNIEIYTSEINSPIYTEIAISTLIETLKLLGVDDYGFENANDSLLSNFSSFNGDVLSYIEANFEEYEVLDNGCYLAKDNTTKNVYVFPSNFTGEDITVGVFIPGQGYSCFTDGGFLVEGYSTSGVPDDFVFVSAHNTMNKDDVLTFCDDITDACGINVGTVKITGFSGGGDSALRAISCYKQTHPDVDCHALLLDPYKATGGEMNALDYGDLSNVNLTFVGINTNESQNRVDEISKQFAQLGCNVLHYNDLNISQHEQSVTSAYNNGVYSMFMGDNYIPLNLVEYEILGVQSDDVNNSEDNDLYMSLDNNNDNGDNNNNLYMDLNYDNVFELTNPYNLSLGNEAFTENILNNLRNRNISLYDQTVYDNSEIYDWGNGKTISSSGCSFMAKCSVLSAFVGRRIPPEYILPFANNDTRLSNIERSIDVYDRLGIKYTRYGAGSGNGDITSNMVVDALQSGKIVEVMVKQVDANRAAHVVLLTGISDDGSRVYVNDSWGPMYERDNHRDWLVSGYPVEKLHSSSEQNCGLGFVRGYAVVVDPMENVDVIQQLPVKLGLILDRV